MILPIQNTLRTRIQDVLAELYELKPADIPDINIQYPPKRTMGDLGITVAFELARTLRKAPRAIANEIVQSIGSIQGISHAEAAPNGYVNVF
ncbi:MAG TPA: arginine--tRNA ligase, partial [Acidobacteria bacterium]|nr:arginine--tRNA ligase [Acidobacteriota bacterium]